MMASSLYPQLLMSGSPAGVTPGGGLMSVAGLHGPTPPGHPSGPPPPTQGPPSSAAGGAGSAPPGGKCCENGRPILTDPHTGQTVCSCQYSQALMMSGYPRVPGLPDGVYSPYATAAAAAAAMQGMFAATGPAAAGADPSAAFYSAMGLQTGYYAYDPSLGYPYANGFAMDPNARRKNATRESTQTLKAWLNEHRKNPYPTKGEKIMLAIITKMTLTQVSTWFANARRRLKKENKMTWSPRNRCGDEDDDEDDKENDDEDNGHHSHGDIQNDDNNNKNQRGDSCGDDDLENCSDLDDIDVEKEEEDEEFESPQHDSFDSGDKTLMAADRLRARCAYEVRALPLPGLSMPHSPISPGLHGTPPEASRSAPGYPRLPGSSPDPRRPDSRGVIRCGVTGSRTPSPLQASTPNPVTTKPKIWSVADVVSSSSSSSSASSSAAAVCSSNKLHPDGSGLIGITPGAYPPQAIRHPSLPPHPAFPQGVGLGMGAPRGLSLWGSPAGPGLGYPYPNFGQSPLLSTAAAHMAGAGGPAARPPPAHPGLLAPVHRGHTGSPPALCPTSAAGSLRHTPTDLRKPEPAHALDKSGSAHRLSDIRQKSHPYSRPNGLQVKSFSSLSESTPTAFRPVSKSRMMDSPPNL